MIFFFSPGSLFLYFQNFDLDVSVVFCFLVFLIFILLIIFLISWSCGFISLIGFRNLSFAFPSDLFAVIFCILSLYGTLITHIRSLDSISHTVGLLYSPVLHLWIQPTVDGKYLKKRNSRKFQKTKVEFTVPQELFT